MHPGPGRAASPALGRLLSKGTIRAVLPHQFAFFLPVILVLA